MAARVLCEAGTDRLPVRTQRITEFLGVRLFTYDDYADATGISRSEVAERFGSDGFTQKINGRAAIFYRKCGYPCRERWTIAHELAHLLLGHLDAAETACATKPEAKGNVAEPVGRITSAQALAERDGIAARKRMVALFEGGETAEGSAVAAADRMGVPEFAHLDRNNRTDPDYAERQANMLAGELLCPAVVVAACGCVDERELARLCDVSLSAARIAVARSRSFTNPTPSEQRLLQSCRRFTTERRKINRTTDIAVSIPPRTCRHRL